MTRKSSTSVSFRMFRRNFLAGMGVCLLAACSAAGPPAGPVERNLVWFDYVGAGDIARRCAEDPRRRLRFVYNAVWGEQVRSYDAVESATGEGAVLTVHVFGGGGLADLELAAGLASLGGTGERRHIDDAAFDSLLRAATGALPAAAPNGAFLRSDDHYWTTAACLGGRFRFLAWRSQDAAPADLPFVADLMRLDRTGVPLARPSGRALGPFPPPTQGDRNASGGSPRQAFRLQVGDNGLRSSPL